jgi:hypothetical protein
MWYFSESQSTLIQMNQINVESQNNVHHIKSPFWWYYKVEAPKGAKDPKWPGRGEVESVAPHGQSGRLARQH